jgi:hypothetical protein
MGRKNRKATPAQAEAGKRNLERFLEQAAEPPALKHGAYSSMTRKRFNDRRTREGRALDEVMRTLVRDLGGEGSLDIATRLTLSSIKAKLMIMFLISGWLHENGDRVISKDGNMPEVIDKLRIFSESLSKDLSHLFGNKKGDDTSKGYDPSEAIIAARERVAKARAEEMEEKQAER